MRRLLLAADLVVVGELDLTLCRDGCLGTIAVDRVVAAGDGIDAPGAEIHFTTEPPLGGMHVGPVRVVAFVHRDPGDLSRWRLALTSERGVGLDDDRADEVAAAHAALPRAINTRDVEPFAGALEVLRAHDQSQWNGAPIVDPARRVFENLDLRGLDTSELTALIGAPASEAPVGTTTLWSYTFHDGEQGVLAAVYVGPGDRVMHVSVDYGQ